MPVFLLFRRLPSHRTTGPSPHPPPHPHPHPPRVHIRRHRRGGFVFEYGIPYVHGNFCFIMDFIVGIADFAVIDEADLCLNMGFRMCMEISVS